MCSWKPMWVPRSTCPASTQTHNPGTPLTSHCRHGGNTAVLRGVQGVVLRDASGDDATRHCSWLGGGLGTTSAARGAAAACGQVTHSPTELCRSGVTRTQSKGTHSGDALSRHKKKTHSGDTLKQHSRAAWTSSQGPDFFTFPSQQVHKSTGRPKVQGRGGERG